MKPNETNQKIKELTQILNLKPHPEGGFYNETYRSEGVVTNPYDGADERSFSTAIYFLLVSGNFSAFHRIRQDEMWHFYDGEAIDLHVISKDGIYSLVKIGNNFAYGEVPQYVVKAGDWFASEVSVENGYSLAGCTVSPGFEFEDFEMATSKELLKLNPSIKELILRLTR
tara:strand:+ start:28110 stop:28619 length:510 start_codon:yes stop_codon:yes gene_type:complete